MALIHWLQLSLTRGIGPILARRLIETAGSVEAACAADGRIMRGVEGIGPAKSEKLVEALRAAGAEAVTERDRARDADAKLICPDDETYPVLLRNIPDPPLVLYVKGTLEPRDLNAVAIVGSRRCSYYGREQSERFGALLGGAGVSVISGGARGIDSAAHRGAMAHPNGRTLAVLGCGVNVVYPPENKALFEQITERGALVSEYPINSPPVPENFPKRNRIVSGMSRGVLVIEADERSGALITARQAGDDHGRPVFALPGRVDNQLSIGPHLLIRDGATLVTRLEDILEGLGPLPQEALDLAEMTPMESHAASHASLPQKTERTDHLNGLTEDQRLILSHLTCEAVGVDQLIDLTGLDASIVVRELTFLCLKGVARRMDGQTFACVSR